jgi:catechol 2,3-dioxygenase-like lactoylglutathione lyase family enzyme
MTLHLERWIMPATARTRHMWRPARKAHPAVRAEDLDVLADRLRAAGHPVQFDQDLPGYGRFYVAVPFGNRLEFLEPASGTPAV